MNRLYQHIEHVLSIVMSIRVRRIQSREHATIILRTTWYQEYIAFKVSSGKSNMAMQKHVERNEMQSKEYQIQQTLRHHYISFTAETNKYYIVHQSSEYYYIYQSKLGSTLEHLLLRRHTARRAHSTQHTNTTIYELARLALNLHCSSQKILQQLFV